MRPDTPLDEVARFLPVDAAKLLVNQPIEVQTLVCKRVKDAVVFLEALDVILDPITFAAVVTLLVAQDIPIAHEIKGLLMQIQELKKHHDPA